MTIFTVGSIICGVSSSSSMLIGGRAVQGVGSAGMINGVFAVIAAAAPAEQKPSLFTTEANVLGLTAWNKCLLGLAWPCQP